MNERSGATEIVATFLVTAIALFVFVTFLRANDSTVMYCDETSSTAFDKATCVFTNTL